MFKPLVIPALIIGVTIPLVAQSPRRPAQVKPRAQQGRLQQPLQQRLQNRPVQRVRGLRKSLNLTPDQTQTFRGLVQGNKAQRQAIHQDVRQKAQAVRDLRSQSNPNPTDLGNALLALKQARSRGQDLREQTMNTFKNSLTADQLKTLESLQAAPRRRPR